MVLTRQPVKRHRLVDVHFEPAGELGIFAAHLVSQAARSRRASGRSRRSYKQPNSCRQSTRRGT
jgi:hypothetical protein